MKFLFISNFLSFYFSLSLSFFLSFSLVIYFSHFSLLFLSRYCFRREKSFSPSSSISPLPLALSLATEFLSLFLFFPLSSVLVALSHSLFSFSLLVSRLLATEITSIAKEPQGELSPAIPSHSFFFLLSREEKIPPLFPSLFLSLFFLLLPLSSPFLFLLSLSPSLPLSHVLLPLSVSRRKFSRRETRSSPFLSLSHDGISVAGRDSPPSIFFSLSSSLSPLFLLSPSLSLFSLSPSGFRLSSLFSHFSLPRHLPSPLSSRLLTTEITSVARRGGRRKVFLSPLSLFSLSLSLSFSLLIFPLSPSLSRDGNFFVSSSLSSSSLSFLSLCRFCRSDPRNDWTDFDRSDLIGILKERGSDQLPEMLQTKIVISHDPDEVTCWNFVGLIVISSSTNLMELI